MDKAAAAEAYGPAALDALHAFPIEPAGLELVSVSENVTFRVRDANDGATYVLRLHRPGYHSLDELMSERVWIRALGDAGIAVPPPLTARDGREYVAVSVSATGEKRYVGVSRWTEGRVLADVLRHTEDVGEVDGDRLTVIDFDDSGFGWHQYDAAVALFHSQTRSDFATVERGFLRGYRSARDISDDALALIPMFRLIRGMAVIGWISQRPELDTSEYFAWLRENVCTQCATFESPC